MTLPQIATQDWRQGGFPGYIAENRDNANALLDGVLNGMGWPGQALKPLLPIGDRIAERWLRASQDPYLEEILTLRRMLNRPGPIAFSLSYEFGCTTRCFDRDPGPVLFRSLDWPFHGLGDKVEIIHLRGPAGDWTTATWPGVIGVLHGTAHGRFAAALNQAPERSAPLGKAWSWLASKRRFLRSRNIPPPHLLRKVFEAAESYSTARRMLCETPVAAPVIFTLIGPNSDEACVIERTETEAQITRFPAAANHFSSELAGADTWRARGHWSPERFDSAVRLSDPPDLEALVEPILNPLTRLAMILSPDGEVSVAGFEGNTRVTAVTRVS